MIKTKVNRMKSLSVIGGMFMAMAAAGTAVEAAGVPLADPFILLYENRYYAYGTNSPDGIAVFVSDDLQTWQRGEGRAQGGLALHKGDSYGEKWFWAPEVYQVGERFHMYYTAEEHVCVAVAEHPLGPFRQVEKKPLIEGEKTIDNTLFIDDDGKAYMFFDRFNDGLNVWSVELTDDLLHVVPESWRFCIRQSQAWETKCGRVNEGSFVIRHAGRYYMTYSGNGYTSQDYGIGCAVAETVGGLWRKRAENPLLQRCGSLVGVGHSAMFRDREGRLRIVFHAHRSTQQIHPRCMYIGTVTFTDDDVPRMVISQDYLTPVLKQN